MIHFFSLLYSHSIYIPKGREGRGVVVENNPLGVLALGEIFREGNKGKGSVCVCYHEGRNRRKR